MLIKNLNKIAIGSSLFIAMSANAAPVTLFGTTINYVYDDAQLGGLFGTPTIIGDTVRFFPLNFRAQSDDGAGYDEAAQNFVFDRVYSVDGTDIMDITVTEFGDYEITNDGVVSQDVLLTAASNNTDNPLDFTSSSASFDASGDSVGLQTWQVSTSIDPSLDFTGPATDIAISLQNTLTATTDAQGEVAWIQKKLTFVATTEVPVPAAAWLFGSALIGLAGIKRRK